MKISAKEIQRLMQMIRQATINHARRKRCEFYSPARVNQMRDADLDKIRAYIWRAVRDHGVYEDDKRI